MLVTRAPTLGPSLNEAKHRVWLYVGAGLALLIHWFVVPRIPTLAAADLFTRHLPLSLAPVNWALFFLLAARREGPLLMPKSVSILLHVLWLASFLFFLGSWRTYPSVSPVLSVLAYFEIFWLIPWWGKALNQ